MRLLVSWSRIEPAPGRYDERYLDEVERAVELLAKRGVYSIVDLHQDAWGPTLAARPGEVCGPGTGPTPPGPEGSGSAPATCACSATCPLASHGPTGWPGTTS